MKKHSIIFYCLVLELIMSVHSIDCNAQLMQRDLPLHDGVSLFQRDDEYTIRYEMNNILITVDTVKATNGNFVFSNIALDDDYFDRLDIAGLPSLPFFAVNLRLPNYDSEISVSVTDLQTIDIKLDYDFIPTQIHGPNDSVLNYDSEYYSNYNHIWYWNEFEWNSYIMPLNYGLGFSIFPFHYEPLSKTLTVVESATYKIHVNRGGLEQTLNNKNILALTHFDNYSEDDADVSTSDIVHQLIDGSSFLIIAHNQFNCAPLYKFVNHKINKGYNIDYKFCPGDMPATSKGIIQFLDNYHEEHPDLLYVLLIGTPDLIPFSAGIQENDKNPPTDLQYVLLPDMNHQSSDFNYSYYLGRWPVAFEDELSNIVDKTIKNENTLAKFSPSRVSIFSGSGSHKKFSYHIAKAFAKIINYIDNTDTYLFDGRNVTHEDALQNMKDELSGAHGEYPWIFTYFGHGDVHEISIPFKFGFEEISSSVNCTLDFQPFAFAYTCWLGNIYEDYNFTRAWLYDKNGGVSMLASTTISYEPYNWYFAKNTFSPLKSGINRSLGELVFEGMQKFYTKCKTLPRWRTIRRYNLYGDPSLFIWGIDWKTSQSRKNVVFDSARNENISWLITDEAVLLNLATCRVQLFAVNGACVFDAVTDKVPIFAFSSGWYIIKVSADNGDIRTDKIYIHNESL